VEIEELRTFVEVAHTGGSLGMGDRDSRSGNKTDRVVVLNDVPKSVIDSVQGEHREYVFTRASNPLTGMNNSGWKAARRRAAARYEETLKGSLPEWVSADSRADLKHRFGRRLRKSRIGATAQLGDTRKCRKNWWKERDSNPRPRHYECRQTTKRTLVINHLPRASVDEHPH
jgi:hypothetical protein